MNQTVIKVCLCVPALALVALPALAVNAIFFPAAAGSIPCAPPDKLEMDKGPGVGGGTFFWSPSCAANANDYAIYEGNLGQWYTHTAVDCIDNGTRLQEPYLFPATGDLYYLVVPLDTDDEGGYGRKSVPPLPAPPGRPRGTVTCRPTQNIGCQFICP